MTEQLDDVAVLSGKSVDIELAGRSYTWKELPRRRARVMRARLAEVLYKMQAGDHSILEAPNWMLDFFYEFHPKMKAQSVRLDNADDDEIKAAFMQIFKTYLEPYLEKKSQAELKSTGNPDAMN
jgi:hypothetical protein